MMAESEMPDTAEWAQKLYDAGQVNVQTVRDELLAYRREVLRAEAQRSAAESSEMVRSRTALSNDYVRDVGRLQARVEALSTALAELFDASGPHQTDGDRLDDARQAARKALEETK